MTFGEGMTPLLPSPRLGKRIGLDNLWIKDESQKYLEAIIATLPEIDLKQPLDWDRISAASKSSRFAPQKVAQAAVSEHGRYFRGAKGDDHPFAASSESRLLLAQNLWPRNRA